MGVTVAPLTTTVMSAVDSRRAGLASGINNAVARASGLLAIAALGVVLLARFGHVLGRELEAAGVPAATRAFLEDQRSKLAAADMPGGADAASREAIVRLLDVAFVSGFRCLMLSCAALSAAAALVSLVWLAPRPKAPPV